MMLLFTMLVLTGCSTLGSNAQPEEPKPDLSQLAHQAAQQGGLADTVGADDGDALAHLHAQIQAGEQLFVIEAFRQALHFHRVAEQLLVLLEHDVGVLAAGRLDVLQLDLVDLLRAGGGLLGFRRVGREAADELLQIGDLRFLLGVIGALAFQHLGGGGHVLVVVARVETQLAVVQVRHVRAHAVQEVAVVGDDDHGAIALVEHAFQPADGVDVQVGSGFSDELRTSIWNDQASHIGRMIEVRYQEVTPDGSLRFPTFVCFRNDR